MKGIKKMTKEQEIQVKTIRRYSQDIGMEFGMETICHTYNQKWEKTNSGRNRTTKLRRASERLEKIRNQGKK